MMIRKPIPLAWRVGLGTASILLLILIYTILSQVRAAPERAQQREDAQERLTKIAQQLETTRAERESVSQVEDSARDARLEELDTQISKLEADQAKWTRLREHPDAYDRSTPPWSALYTDGLIRAITPQGQFEHKELWLWMDLVATAKRLVVGLLTGIIISLLIALPMGCYDQVEAFFLPPFAFMAKIPPTAMFAVFLLLGSTVGEFRMFVIIICFGMVPTFAQGISQSVRKDIADQLIFKAYTLGASQLEIVWSVIFRQILPRILDGIRLQIGPAMVLLVAAEWMVADEGFGYRLRLFFQRTDMTIVFFYCFLLGAIGLATDYALVWLRRKLCPWFGD